MPIYYYYSICTSIRVRRTHVRYVFEVATNIAKAQFMFVNGGKVVGLTERMFPTTHRKARA